jgi:hypothetical protein
VGPLGTHQSGTGLYLKKGVKPIANVLIYPAKTITKTMPEWEKAKMFF